MIYRMFSVAGEYMLRFREKYYFTPQKRQIWKLLLLALVYLHLIFLPEIIALPLCINYRTSTHLYMQNIFLLLSMAGVLLIFHRIVGRIFLVLYGLWGAFNVVNIFSLIKFHIILDATMLQILAITDKNEVREFSQTYIHWYDFFPFILIIFFIVILWKYLLNPTPFGKRVGIMLCIPFCLLSLFHLCTGQLKWFGKRNALCRFISTGLVQYNDEMKKIHSELLRPELPDDIHFIPPESMEKTNNLSEQSILGVVVVGESARRHNFQCYGYSRNTTPNLLSFPKDSIFFFDDVISPATSTMRCCIYDFSMSSIGHFASPQYSICDLLKSAGYFVALYSNQRRSGAHESLGLLFHNADVKSYLMEDGHGDRYDMELLSCLEKMFLDEQVNKPTIIFLHTMGSHHNAKKRYPAEYTFFQNDLRDENNEGFDDVCAEYVNYYDNSIRYTDEFLGKVISLLQKQNRPVFMLYLSDHAEILAKEKSDTDFRNAQNPFSYEIPFIIYANEAYKNTWPTFFREWANSIHKPMQADATIFMVASLARITYKNFPDDMNILSPRFNPKPRYMKETTKAIYSH